MTGLWHDLKYAYRMLLKNPAVTAVVVVAMGLGIGCTTMIFSVVNTILVKGLPFREPERLVIVESHYGGNAEGDGMSYPDLLDLRQRAKSLDDFAAYAESQAYLTLAREPERFKSAYITPGLLHTLGIKPHLGREFVPEEGEAGKQYGAVILGYRIWKDRLASDPNVLGRTLRMNGRVRAVVGVMPPGIRFPESADFWIPLAYDPKEDSRSSRYMTTLARIARGGSLAGARAELALASRTIAAENPKTNDKVSFSATIYHERLVEDMRPTMAMLMSAVVFVLLIACANVANLMLARATARQREIGLRSAIGASRARIARQLLIENLLVALAGGLLGVLIATWSNDIVLGSIPTDLPYWMRFGIDGTALLFALAVTLGSGLLFGLAPVLHLWKSSLNDSLKEASAQTIGGRGHHRLRQGLVVAEIALALVLLAGAGLMIRSFLRMQDARAGLDAENVLTGRVTLPVAVYPEDADRRAFFSEFLGAVGRLPGVESVSATSNLPLGEDSWTRTVIAEGQERDAARRHPAPNFSAIAPRYFETLRIPLLAGRDFAAADRESAMRVAIVNRSAARLLWPDQDPIGKRLRFDEDSVRWCTVVGMVGDVRQSARNPRRVAQVFVPHAQQPIQTLSLVVRTHAHPGALAGPVRRLLEARNPDLPFYDARSLTEAIHLALWQPRLYASLMGFYAAIALVIAAVGIYGVMAYSVAQRTREIGIRMALGAARGSVLAMVVGQGMRLTAIGLGIGLAFSFAVTRLMASLLFGVTASDPPTYLGVLTILAASALLACWLPAHRATRVDPMVALRSE